MSKIWKFLFNPRVRFDYLSRLGFLDRMSDIEYIKKKYYLSFNKQLDLDNPQTFNEKLQWLKLNDRKNIYTVMVDKYNVKEYVSGIIGKQYVIPTIGVFDSFNDIDLNKLPDQFVIKCTHDSGGLVVVDDKENLDFDLVRKKISSCLRTNYYYCGREWPYKNVKPRIIVEKYLIDKKVAELRDYKFFCFDGKVRFFKVDYNRFTDHQANYYDRNCSLLKFGEEVCPPDFKKKIIMPSSLKKMMKLAEKLSKDIPFVRVDFYDVNGDIYFGEMTFYPASGFGKFIPEEWDIIIGEMLELPIGKEKNNENKTILK